MLYSWRSKRRQTGQPFEEHKLQQAEAARLNRENTRLEESVSRSGYYRWKQQPIPDRSRADQLLTDDIKRVFDDEKGHPGSPRITQRLQAEGKSAGLHRAAQIIRDNG